MIIKYKTPYLRKPKDMNMRRIPHTRKNHGFTLIELLIVIAIMGILSCLLLPALRKALQTAYSVSCLNHQRILYRAVCSYAADNNNFFPYSRPPAPLYRWSNRDALGQYWGKTSYGPYSTDETGIHYCPSAEKKWGDRHGVIALNYKLTGTINGPSNMNRVKYPSKTCILADGVTDRWWYYVGGYDSLYNVYGYGLPPSKASWAIRHNEGCNTTFVDGHGCYVQDMEVENNKGNLTLCVDGADL